MSIYVGVLQRQTLLHSIRKKASIQAKKAHGKVYGNVQNFTAAGRKLGLEKIKSTSITHAKKQQIQAIIRNCQAANMSYGEIAEALNQNRFTTIRGKRFYRNTVRRLAMSM
ncbi:MAG: recombinase family protein [Bacteroidota bacterium]